MNAPRHSSGTVSKRFKWAIVTSILPKIATVALNFAAIPIAIAALGVEKFGIFSTASSVLALMTFSELGVGPVLTRWIAMAAADQERQRELFVTALATVTAGSLVGGGLLASLLLAIGHFQLLPASFDKYQATFIAAALISTGIGVAQIILGVVTRTRAGLHEIHVTNYYMAGGNLLSVILLLLSVAIHPSVEGMVLSIYGGPLLAGAANGVALVVKRPYLLRFQGGIKANLVSQFVKDGLRYSFVQFTPVTHREYYKWLLAIRLGPSAAGIYGIAMQVASSFGGLITMVTTPLLPAVSASVAEHRIQWVRRTWITLSVLLVIYGMLVTAALSFAVNLVPGGNRWQLLLQDRKLVLIFGCYFLVVTWTHLQFVLLMAIGKLRDTSRILAFEYVLVVLFSIVLYQWPSVATALGSLAIICACVSGRLFFEGVRGGLRDLQNL